jgi:homoserine dehydrogenase
MAPFRIGLVGLGNVGQGVVRLLQQNGEEIARRLGRPLQITHAAARDLQRSRDCDLSGITLGTDALALAREADVDVVVELIGGQTLAADVILAALQRGKPVVTANKALLAEDGNRIFAAARRADVPVAFEAAVAGGIPIIKAIREGLAGNRIESLAGIINGTSNYILTQMAEKGETFADALAQAQKLGYAEADPSFDIQGVDAAHKLTILASIAFGMPLNFAAIATEGITAVTPQDIRIAHALGYRIKHLGIAKRGPQGVELRVHPTLIPEDRLLAKVDGVLNSILLQGNAVGQVGFYGRGAGGEATASAVIADLIDVARAAGTSAVQHVPALGFQPAAIESLAIVPPADVQSAYYLRLRVLDEPGVLKAITSIFAELDISIEAILQREPREDDDATVAVITSMVPERHFNDAVVRIEAQPFVRESASRFKVEHF